VDGDHESCDDTFVVVPAITTINSPLSFVCSTEANKLDIVPRSIFSNILVMCQPCSLLAQTSFFIGFEPCHVRFEPYPDRVVHANQGYMSHISADGPEDTLSVKNGATGQDIGQKLDNCELWRCSQRASEAGRWTDYASPVRTKTQSNHTSQEYLTQERSSRGKEGTF
jgi:hypothetical protein